MALSLRLLSRASLFEASVSATVTRKLPEQRSVAGKVVRDEAQPKPKSAMEYIAAVEPIGIDGDRVECDGDSGDPALGHPRVYINLEGSVPATCGYCGLRYFNKSHHH